MIVGVDPGKITGVAIWLPEWSLRKIFDYDEVPAAQTIPWIKNALGVFRPTHVACEHFIQGSSRRPMTRQPDAEHVTGALEAYAAEEDSMFVRQPPGPAKKLASDRNLKAIDWFHSTPDGHENDARRQVLLCIATYFPRYYERLTGI